ncbi:hypothetical protein SCAZ3_03450 [Streptococcus canis FSL Z3-227]|uniref:Uncharacterized protein n=1 Tax=Streptococcus canis FSL Z3-227 TaxID=482234 RepID=A0AAV3FQL5_STRCB|nr:hypothetical protein SCAZ3_03450 [Streptococcus canis FSL Z3-227]
MSLIFWKFTEVTKYTLIAQTVAKSLVIVNCFYAIIDSILKKVILSR